jgi:hypothetical protein
MKTFVVAGTYQEAQNWIAKNFQERVAMGDQQASTNDYKYVSHEDDIKGYTNPHGVFVGNWLGRPDIFEIVQALLIRTTTPNAALGKIYNQVKPKVRPTPKLKGMTPVSVIVDEAANLLAKEIDKEVLKSLMKTNGGII